MKYSLFLVLSAYCWLTACTTSPAVDPITTPVDSTSVPADSITNSKFTLFTRIVFTPKTVFSTTDTSFHAPVPSNILDSAQRSHADLAYIYNYGYYEPGFISPPAMVTNAFADTDAEQYYVDFNLANAVKTKFYYIGLNRADMDSIISHPALLDTYWYHGEAGFFRLADNDASWYEHGVIIGARFGYEPLVKGRMFGFQNEVTGKRGLLFIRKDQTYGWPYPIYDANTVVDILKEK